MKEQLSDQQIFAYQEVLDRMHTELVTWQTSMEGGLKSQSNYLRPEQLKDSFEHRQVCTDLLGRTTGSVLAVHYCSYEYSRVLPEFLVRQNHNSTMFRSIPHVRYLPINNTATIIIGMKGSNVISSPNVRLPRIAPILPRTVCMAIAVDLCVCVCVCMCM